ncbi:hypothetical protein DL93DRAFT_2089942 [Clavulina sp. PMI_390]|nr:hypothetical protein DL93DRAFT_2089942 [Clavulina sp. PMI_390]
MSAAWDAASEVSVRQDPEFTTPQGFIVPQSPDLREADEHPSLVSVPRVTSISQRFQQGRALLMGLHAPEYATSLGSYHPPSTEEPVFGGNIEGEVARNLERNGYWSRGTGRRV